MNTHHHLAEVIAADYAAIQAAGGNAAIDYKDGELALRCTMPGRDRSAWGHGAIPAPMGDDWLRIAQTTPHSEAKEDTVETLARRLGFSHMEAQHSDRLDFKEVAVWAVVESLQKAFDAGAQSAGKPSTQPAQNVGAALDRAMELMDEARKALHDALTAGTAVESLVVLPMVAQAAELRREVDRLASARRATE